MNELEMFAKESEDLAWAEFLAGGDPMVVSYNHSDHLGEPDLQELHGLAKAAFVDELAGACGPNDNALTWALSMVPEYALDAGIAKVALDLADEPPAVHDFVFKFAGQDVEYEDLHHLAKVAFVQELDDLCGGDRALVKEALDLVDDGAFDMALARGVMGMEKEALVGALAGGALLGAGAAKLAPKLVGMGTALARGAKRLGGKAMSGVGQKLRASGANTRNVAMREARSMGPAGTLMGDMGAVREGLIRAGKGPGGLRTRLGKRLNRYGDKTQAAANAPIKIAPRKPMPPRQSPASTPKAPKAPPTKSGDVTSKELKELVESSADDMAGAASKTKVVADDVAGAASKTKVDPKTGEPVGLVDGFSGWFDRASPLQKTLAIGVPALGAEAALD